MTQDYESICGSPDEAIGSRKRLREWMIEQLDRETCPGCEWVDRSRLIFKLPWKRIGTSGFDMHSDGKIFLDWAIHTGKFNPNVDDHKKDAVIRKTRIRNAFHKMQDLEYLKHMSNENDEANPYKVYRFRTAEEMKALNMQRAKRSPDPSKRSYSRGCRDMANEMSVLPNAFLLNSSSVVQSQRPPCSGPIESQFSPCMYSNQPVTFPPQDSYDFGMSPSNYIDVPMPARNDNFMSWQEESGMLSAGSSPSECSTPVFPSSNFTSTNFGFEERLPINSDFPRRQMFREPFSEMSPSNSLDDCRVPEEYIPSIVDELQMVDLNHTVAELLSDADVKYFEEQSPSDFHISMKFLDQQCEEQTTSKDTQRVSIAYCPPSGPPSYAILNQVRSVVDIEQILGPLDAMKLYFPVIPESCPKTQMILNAMQRGLVFSITSEGDLYVERLCRARVYYGASPFSINNNNNDKPIPLPRSQRVLIFSFRNQFLPALQAYDQGLQQMPSCSMHFSFGLPWGEGRALRDTLVNMTITHLLAQHLRETKLRHSPSSNLLLSAADELDLFINQMQLTQINQTQ